MTDDENGFRPVVVQPRDLALAGRFLRSVLSGIDCINPFLAVSQPMELELDAIGRLGQARGLRAAREAIADAMNRDRLIEWAGRYRPHSFEIPMPDLTSPPRRRLFGAAGEIPIEWPRLQMNVRLAK